jgi:AraC-like DNA-binding protein/ligand-binding sensor protein
LHSTAVLQLARYPAGTGDGCMDNERQELIERAKQLARHYGISCEVPCNVLDLSQSTDTMPNCPGCNPASSDACCEGCLENLRYSANQAKKFGGSYVFFCPGSLMYWVSPVLFDSSIDIVILAGPVLVIENEDARENIEKIHRHLSSDFTERMKNIKRMSPATVHSKSEILRMCAGWASSYQEQRLIDRWHTDIKHSPLKPGIDTLRQEKELHLYSLKKEDSLQKAIIEKEIDASRKLLQYLVGILFIHSPTNTLSIVSRIQELVTLMTRSALKGGANENKVWQISEKAYNEIYCLHNYQEAYTCLEKLLEHLVSEVAYGIEESYSPFIRKAITYAKGNYESPITINRISEEVTISKSYFCKRFLSETGTTWSNYLNRIRVEKAKILLQDSEDSLLEIAKQTGFEEQSYFSRVFKTVTGMTASKFRKQMKNQLMAKD